MSVATQIDPRGGRFAAVLTSVVLGTVLLTAPSTTSTALLLAQTVFFGIGAVAGVRRTPYSWLYTALVRPRLGAPKELEDAAPPRFAQAVGFAFAVVGLVGYLSGASLLGAVATGFALGAAFLNAAFGLCLGCEAHLLLQRVLARRAAPTSRTNNNAGPIPANTEVSA